MPSQRSALLAELATLCAFFFFWCCFFEWVSNGSTVRKMGCSCAAGDVLGTYASWAALPCDLLPELPLHGRGTSVPGIGNETCCREGGQREDELCLAFLTPFQSARASGIACFFAAAFHRRPGHALNFNPEFPE